MKRLRSGILALMCIIALLEALPVKADLNTFDVSGRPHFCQFSLAQLGEWREALKRDFNLVVGEGDLDRIFVTADHHFNHAAILNYSNRPFRSPAQMRDEFVRRWNETVRPDQEVWILGDVTTDPVNLAGILGRLNGRKFLVLGNHDQPHPVSMRNHDRDLPELPALMQRYLDAGFSGVYLGGRMLIPGVGEVNVSHYPYGTEQGENGSSTLPSHLMLQDGRPLLCGHVHGRWSCRGNMVNVGVDVNDFRPVSLRAVRDGLVSAQNRATTTATGSGPIVKDGPPSSVPSDPNPNRTGHTPISQPPASPSTTTPPRPYGFDRFTMRIEATSLAAAQQIVEGALAQTMTGSPNQGFLRFSSGHGDLFILSEVQRLAQDPQAGNRTFVLDVVLPFEHPARDNLRWRLFSRFRPLVERIAVLPKSVSGENWLVAATRTPINQSTGIGLQLDPARLQAARDILSAYVDFSASPTSVTNPHETDPGLSTTRTTTLLTPKSGSPLADIIEYGFLETETNQRRDSGRTVRGGQTASVNFRFRPGRSPEDLQQLATQLRLLLPGDARVVLP